MCRLREKLAKEKIDNFAGSFLAGWLWRLWKRSEGAGRDAQNGEDELQKKSRFVYWDRRVVEGVFIPDVPDYGHEVEKSRETFVRGYYMPCA